MKIKLFLLYCIISFFSENLNAHIKNQDDIIHHYLQVSESIFCKLMTESPENIKQYEDGKLYLQESKISQKSGNLNAIIHLGNGEMIFAPILLNDTKGSFLPLTMKVVGNKMFKMHCNDCGYEWEGGVFTFQCDREECGSTNIVALPNV